MDPFDTFNVTKLPNGDPELTLQECQECHHTHPPEAQTLFRFPDGSVSGLFAFSDCPQCHKQNISVIGHPEFLSSFVEWYGKRTA